MAAICALANWKTAAHVNDPGGGGGPGDVQDAAVRSHVEEAASKRRI